MVARQWLLPLLLQRAIPPGGFKAHQLAGLPRPFSCRYFHSPKFSLVDEGTSAVSEEMVDKLYSEAKKRGTTLKTANIATFGLAGGASSTA